MKTLAAPAVALAVAALAFPAAAQDAAEDWDLTVNAEQQLTLASLDFGANAMAIRCRAGMFDVLLTGVPVSTADARPARLTTGGIVDEIQVWTTQPGLPVIAAPEPARLARQIRGGGVVDLRLEPATQGERAHRYRLTLPPSTASIDRVLQACDRPLTNDRDLVQRLDPGALTWRRQADIRFPETAGALNAGRGVVELSCIVSAEIRLTDCRAESETPAGVGFAESAIRGAEQAEFDAPGGAATVTGRIVHYTSRFTPPN